MAPPKKKLTYGIPVEEAKFRLSLLGIELSGRWGPNQERTWLKFLNREGSNSGTVSQAPSGWFQENIVRPVNNYVREMVYDLSNHNVPKPKHAVPLATAAVATAYGAVTNPMLTAKTMGTGMLGGELVNEASEAITGNDWATNMSNWTGFDPMVTEMTNPGYYPTLFTNGFRRLFRPKNIQSHNMTSTTASTVSSTQPYVEKTTVPLANNAGTMETVTANPTTKLGEHFATVGKTSSEHGLAVQEARLKDPEVMEKAKALGYDLDREIMNVDYADYFNKGTFDLHQMGDDLIDKGISPYNARNFANVSNKHDPVLSARAMTLRSKSIIGSLLGIGKEHELIHAWEPKTLNTSIAAAREALARKAFKPRLFQPNMSGKYYFYDAASSNPFTEVSARGSLIRNALNIMDNRPLTLKNIEQYKRLLDNGKVVDNNMNDLLNYVQDPDAFVEWLNLYSLKKGGKIHVH